MKRKIVNPELKETVTFIKTAAETNGNESVLDILLQPGGGNPLHYHTSYSELFTALEGDLGLKLKNHQQMILKPGESYLVKKGEVHRFLIPAIQISSFGMMFIPAMKDLKTH